ncbi:AbrB family transcriptional regulator [Pueribacillus theae]|uniref:AbrB family transcriptional regulator n=1 Tax=Pueribacillus theae TaxID=2171751 RepID=A0A2U1JRU9_9BACI|nr:AbrB/MazE/SpoVT family DNA-binding domain-containing protein [Pueribacillus theae]PWA07927.1 AbrB family transcriptional regulator [Pueribacillus theae]
MPLTKNSKVSSNKWIRTLSDRGQTVVPKSIRDYLNVKGGDSLEWHVNENGDVIVKPKKKVSVMDSYGILKPEKSVNDVDQAIRDSKKVFAKKKHKEGRL